MSDLTPTDFSTRVGSRICHDLINPLGAISNGLELLELAGLASGSEEMALVSGSVQSAIARLQLLRFAFGDANPDQRCSGQEVAKILSDNARDGRHSYAWGATGDLARYDVRIAVLALMCVQSALPLGGLIYVSFDGAQWCVNATHDRVTLDPAVWGPLASGHSPATVSAGLVHFALLPKMARVACRTLMVSHDADWVQIVF